MERIKQAIDRARNERSKLQGPNSDSSTVSADAGLENIVYTETTQVQVSPSVMRANRIISASDSSEYVDSFRVLRTQVLHRMVENQWSVLGVTSATPGEGKTVTAINLAISLAMEVQHTVLLVDANLKSPDVAKNFGLTQRAGVTDFLLDDAPLSDLLVNPAGIERFVILPSGREVRNTSEILSSPKMGQLVDELKHRYPQRLVLFDLPPILSASDVMAFSPFIDAALLVVEEGGVSSAEVQHAASMLGSTNLIGTVLNCASGS